MLHALISAFSKPSSEREPKKFPLDAYNFPTGGRRYTSNQVASASATKATNAHATHSHVWLFFTMIGAFFKIWTYALVLTDITRTVCFNDYFHATTPFLPDFLCEHVSPSTVQFWNRFFNKSEDLPNSPGNGLLDAQIRDLRQHIFHPPKAMDRDFALRGAGAFILNDLTSPTHRFPKSQSQRDTTRHLNLNFPTIMLEDNISIGDCWEFEGSVGWVGIMLSEEVSITAMTINYVHPALLPPSLVVKAPRTVTLWALSDPKLSGDLVGALGRSPVEFSASTRIPDVVSAQHVFIPILQANFTLADTNSSQVQRFPANTGLTSTTNVIVIEVTSNWGSGTTCLHHFSIHGRPKRALS